MVRINMIGKLDDVASLAALPELPVNFDEHGSFTKATGWTIDNYCVSLPSEQPGPPEPGGPWETSAGIIKDYDFAEPAIIKAVWQPGEPLLGRNMLLEGKFPFLQFLFGVRITKVIEESRHEDGHPVQAYGWCYVTLQGHFEMGEMCYQVVKQLDTGEVQFHIYRHVKRGHIANQVIRLGFVVFGRFMQVLFVKRSLKRMQGMVRARVAGSQAPARSGIDVTTYDEQPDHRKTA